MWKMEVFVLKNGELSAWMVRHNLNHEQAAEKLGLSVRAFRSQLYGERTLGAQTQLLMALHDKLLEMSELKWVP